jgi:probable HAF family extracellular repeat protein
MRMQASAILALLFAAVAAPAQPAAQFHFKVHELPSLGGSASAANSLNDVGLASGFSNLPGDATEHATAWFLGARRDLGTLGGGSSAVVWPVKNVLGLIAGISQTARPDPLGESWSCSGFLPGGGNTCVGFTFEGGELRALPTLGGNNGFAAGANNRHEITGWAENTVHDPTCTNGQVLQFRPVVYGPGREQIRELPLLTGDSSGAATGINDRGQAIGISGVCDQAVGRFTAAHAVLWDEGRVVNLGNLGGVAWNTPMALNQRGDVAGFANVPGGATTASLNERAFLWTREGGIQNLGALPGDVHSQALGINEKREVVGVSCTAHFASCRGFLWQDGVMTDLGTRLDPETATVLVAAQDINDEGQIAAQVLDPETGQLLAAILTPERTNGAAGEHRAAKLPEEARQRLLQQLGLGRVDDER